MLVKLAQSQQRVNGYWIWIQVAIHRGLRQKFNVSFKTLIELRGQHAWMERRGVRSHEIVSNHCSILFVGRELVSTVSILQCHPSVDFLVNCGFVLFGNAFLPNSLVSGIWAQQMALERYVCAPLRHLVPAWSKDLNSFFTEHTSSPRVMGHSVALQREWDQVSNQF